jgi:hypothetical protein
MKRTQQQLEVEIETCGHLNAYTSREQTVYFAKVFKDDVGKSGGNSLIFCLHSNLDEAAIERERDILREMSEVNKQQEELVLIICTPRRFKERDWVAPFWDRKKAFCPWRKGFGRLHSSSITRRRMKTLPGPGGGLITNSLWLQRSILGDVPGRSRGWTGTAMEPAQLYREVTTGTSLLSYLLLFIVVIVVLSIVVVLLSFITNH